MPFTFSHPAIAFPIRWVLGSWTSITGLVIGSMVPDFEKFIKMAPNNTFSHTLGGIFWFNLPLGIILCFVFHRVVRNPLIESTPEHLRKRLYKYKSVDWPKIFKRNYLGIMVSIIIGAASHLIWDAFTHSPEKVNESSRGIIQLNPDREFYQQFINTFDGLSSILGLVFIYGVMLSLPKLSVPYRSGLKKLNYWIMCFTVALVIVLLRLLVDLSIDDFWHLVITSISSFLIGLIVASLLIGKTENLKIHTKNVE